MGKSRLEERGPLVIEGRLRITKEKGFQKREGGTIKGITMIQRVYPTNTKKKLVILQRRKNGGLGMKSQVVMRHSKGRGRTSPTSGGQT